MDIYLRDYDHGLFIINDVPADGMCLFHSLCANSGYSPYKHSTALKQNMLSHINVMDPFGNISAAPLSDQVSNNYSVWKKKFNTKSYWGTEFDMVFYSLLYKIDVICIQSGSHGSLLSTSSYCLIDFLIEVGNLPSNLKPSICISKQYVYLHVSDRLIHNPGFYELQRKVWSYDVPTGVSENGKWYHMKANHYACLQKVPETSVGCIVYNGGPSIQQIAGIHPNSLFSNRAVVAPLPTGLFNQSEGSTKGEYTKPVNKKRSRIEDCGRRSFQYPSSDLVDNLSMGSGTSGTISSDTDEPVTIPNRKNTRTSGRAICASGEHSVRLAFGVNDIEILQALTDDESDVLTNNEPGVHTMDEIAENYAMDKIAENYDITAEDCDATNPIGKYICANCYRSIKTFSNCASNPYLLDLELVSTAAYKSSKSRKFCFIECWETTSFHLCRECKKYMDTKSSTTSNRNAGINWPAFVWSVLRNEVLYWKAWEFVVDEWREWWLEPLCMYHQITREVLVSKVCEVAEVTLATELDVKALHELSWVNNIMPREESLTFPSVRCPAGCSEWKHRATNSLPLDIIWEYLLETELCIYSSDKLRGCINWFRRDFVDPTRMVGNPAWVCRASINLDRSKPDPVPEFLTCRHHKKTDNCCLVHPPQSPSGTIFNDKANQFAPVVAIPRTLQKTKISEFSASFRLASLEGSYEGIDTMFLSADGGNHHFQSAHAWRRETLAASRRTDIKSHIGYLKEQCVIPNRLAGALVSDAERLYPNWENEKDAYLKGATYVSIDDSLKLQKGISVEGTETATVTTTVEGRNRMVSFASPWPRHITWVHPAGDKYGRIFPALLPFKQASAYDTRASWLVCSIITTQPQIWNAVVKVSKRDWEWEGWTLMKIASVCFPHYRLQNRSTNPFSTITNLSDLTSLYLQAFEQFAPSDVHDKFLAPLDDPTRYSSVLTLYDTFTEPEDPQVSIVIVTNQNKGFEGLDEHVPVPTLQVGSTFEKVFDGHGVFTGTVTALPTLENPYFEVMYEDGDEEDLTEEEIGVFQNGVKKVYTPWEAVSGNWEMRFIALTSTGRSQNTWKGTVYCRHGGDCHPYWWKLERDVAIAQKMEVEWDVNKLVGSARTDWNACVYVKREPYTPLHIRQLILEACGGQAKVYCGVHKKPLITVVNRQGRKCSCPKKLPAHVRVDQEDQMSNNGGKNESCSSKAKYQCSVRNCLSGICKLHHAQVLDIDAKFYVAKRVGDCQYGQDPILTDSFDRGRGTETEVEYCAEREITAGADSDSEEDDSQCSSEIYSNHVQGEFQTGTKRKDEKSGHPLNGMAAFRYNDEDIGDDPIESHFMLMENLDPTDFLTSTIQGMDDVEEESSLFGTEREHAIPTTNAGVQPIYSVVDDEPYYSNKISNHALLNVFGGCLMRRKSRLTGTLYQKNFLQRLSAISFDGAASTPRSLPLLYPEGMLFTDLFYIDETDGSTTGAIPSSMLHNEKSLHQYGLASLKEHYRTRLSNPGLLASANPKYHFFAFDCLQNLGMRGCDSRIILRRGFAEMQGSGGVKMRGDEQPIFDTEAVDCRPVVSKLAAAIGEEEPSYFYTHTCNMKEGFGMRHIWKWLSSEELLDCICEGNETEAERADLRKAAFDSAGVLILRAWMELNHLWLRYICHSPDRPLGRVTKFTSRAELQEEKANVPHFHTILWTDDDLSTKEGLNAVLDRIRGSIQDIVRKNEADQYVEDGLFENHDAVLPFLAMMTRILRHKHQRRCFITVKDKENDTYEQKLHCKVADNYNLSCNRGGHCFIDVPIVHTQEAIHVMQEIGVAKRSHVGGSPDAPLTFEPLLDCLIAKKHIPPAHGDEGIISPVCGALVVKNPCSDNLQFPTGYTLARYLAKYVLSIDTYNVLKIRPPKAHENKNEFHISGEMLLNTKITGNKISVQDKTAPRHSARVVQGRAICIMETYMGDFDYHPIITNINYILIPTQPYEERTGKERLMKPIVKLLKENKDFLQDKALTAINTVPSHHARSALPQWRQFTASQIRKVEDELQSPLFTDAVTIFGLRPPELRFIMLQSRYAKWFVRTLDKEVRKLKLQDVLRYCKTLIKDDIYESSWIDATTNTVKVRRHAIPEVLAYAVNSPDLDFGGRRNKGVMIKLFKMLQVASDYVYAGIIPETRSVLCPKLKGLCDRLVCEGNEPFLPVTWMRPIRPTLTNRFLIGLLLSLGSFVDEYQLFSCGSLRESFIKARLLDENAPAESAKHLMQCYFKEQHRILTSGTPTFDMYLVVAYNTIMDLFVHNRMYSNELPTVLYCRLHDDTVDSVMAHQKRKRLDLVHYLVNQMEEAGLENIPTKEAFVEATMSHPVEWDISNCSRPAGQPVSSYVEQQKVLRRVRRQIDSYTHGKRECTKGVCTVGAGGVGKTMCGVLMSLLYAAGQGLTVATTALMSERAKELAGEHINSLLCIPSNSSLSPGQLAERAISKLYRNPEKLEFLRRIDVLGVDEGGCVPAEFWSILDTILRYIRNSSKPFGGLLILVSMDNQQIDPCKGRHPLMSPLFISSFVFMRLLHSVRAAFDHQWQRIQEITRMSKKELESNSVKKEFIRLLCKYCTWVDSETSPMIPPDALFVFGKHAPIREQETKMFQRLRSIKCKKVHAQDEERTVEGEFVVASKATTLNLNRNVREPEVLHLYKGGRYQLTYNKRRNNLTEFSNTQLAVLFEVPSDQVLARFGEFKMVVAPPGNKYIPNADDTEEYLTTLGWVTRMVGCPPGDRVQFVRRGLRGKRRQYGLRHHVGSTVHAVMGATLKTMVTRVERGRHNKYSLWLKSQVVVLSSRTRLAKDTIFISQNKKLTAETLYDVIKQTSAFQEHISYLLDKLCGDAVMPEPMNEIDMGHNGYCPCNVALPHDTTGQVYILVSLTDINFVYIGSTKNIVRRLQEHNSGFGSQQTAVPSLRPWALLAYVTGFDGNKINLKRFENRWIMAKERYLQERASGHSVEGIVNLATDVMDTFDVDLNLRVVHCGTIRRAREVQDCNY